MKEVRFIRQNSRKWKNIERYVAGHEPSGPDQLADAFLELTDDLAYARTFYPASDTTAYLNGLTAKLHQAIYRNRKEQAGRLWIFWRYELPQNIFACGGAILTSFAIMLTAVAVGVISTLYDDTFVRLILGDQYVNLTLENISKGDPLGVYKRMNEVDMFLGITVNNIRVALLAFAAGTLFSVGTGYILFSNGVMLGAFHTFFYQHGLLATGLKTIWIHGTLEIAAIIIAGGAGLTMGNALLFPGTYARAESFKRGARRGLRVVIGLVPIFVVAGFLEGFVTRHTEMPLAVSLLIITASFVFLLAYFLVLPRQEVRQSTMVPERTLN